MGNKQLAHLVLVSLEPLTPSQLQALHASVPPPGPAKKQGAAGGTSATPRLVVVQLEPADLQEGGERRRVRAALAAAGAQLPPFAAVVRWADAAPSRPALAAQRGAQQDVAVPLQAISSAELAARVTRVAGLPCEVADVGLGVAWGRQLLPGLTYLVAAPQAADAVGLVSSINAIMACGPRAWLHASKPEEEGRGSMHPASCYVSVHAARLCRLRTPLTCSCASSWVQVEMLVVHKSLRHLVLLTLDAHTPAQMSAQAAWLAEFNAQQQPGSPAAGLVVLTVAADDVGATGQGQGLRAALAAAAEMLPPFAAVLCPAGDAAAEVRPAPVQGTAVAAGPAPVPSSAAVPAPPSEPRLTSQQLKAVILDGLAGLLGAEVAQQVPETEPIMSAGLTSSLAVQLVASLEDALGCSLPGTLVFDYPTIDEMAAFLATELASSAAPASTPPPPTKRGWPSPPPFMQAPAGAAPHPRPGADAPSRQQLLSEMVSLVLQEVGSLLGMEASAGLSADAPLMSAGLTSSLAVQLVASLEAALGCELPGTLVFDYPSAPEIAEFLLETSAPQAEAAAPPPAAAVPSWAGRPGAAAPTAQPVAGQQVGQHHEQRQQTLKQQLTALVLEHVAGLPGGSDAAGDTPLMSAGLTSSLAVQLVASLEDALGCELPGTLVFDYPSAAEIAGFLLESGLAPALAAPSQASAAGLALADPAVGTLAAAAPPAAPICVITGTAHTVPGGKLAWQAASGNDRITPVPLERWDTELPPADSPSERNQQFGSFLR